MGFKVCLETSRDISRFFIFLSRVSRQKKVEIFSNPTMGSKLWPELALSSEVTATSNFDCDLLTPTHSHGVNFNSKFKSLFFSAHAIVFDFPGQCQYSRDWSRNSLDGLGGRGCFYFNFDGISRKTWNLIKRNLVIWNIFLQARMSVSLKTKKFHEFFIWGRSGDLNFWPRFT